MNFNTVYKFLKESKFIKSQSELATMLKNQNGNKVSQPFIAALASGTSIPRHIASQITQIFPFISYSYLLRSDHHPIDIKKLLQFICKKEDFTQKVLVKTIDDKNINEPYLSKMDNHSDINDWKKVFYHININFNYNIIVEEIFELNSLVLSIGRSNELKSPQAERLFEIIEYLMQKGEIKSVKEFAEEIGESHSNILNIRNASNKRDVTKDIMVKTSNKWPSINLYWWFHGYGNIERPKKVIMDEILLRLNKLEKRD